MEMDKDSASGPDRAGARWPLFVTKNEPRSSPDFSGPELLRVVVQKIAAGDLKTHVSHILSAANLLPMDKGEENCGRSQSTLSSDAFRQGRSYPPRFLKRNSTSIDYKSGVASNAGRTQPCSRKRFSSPSSDKTRHSSSAQRMSSTRSNGRAGKRY